MMHNVVRRPERAIPAGPIPRFWETRCRVAWLLTDVASVIARVAHALDDNAPPPDAAARAWEEGYRLGYGRRLRRLGHRRGAWSR